MMNLLSLARENGFSHIGEANMDAIVPLEEVRRMCSADRCGKWNRSWACPPACGSIDRAKRILARYNRGVLVQTVGSLSDSFDYTGMEAAAAAHKRGFINFVRQARMILPDCLPLSAGTCTLCARCTYPDRPCRYPDRRLSSMEAFGLFVSDICLRSGLSYNYGPNTIAYTSCLLYTEE